MPLGGGKDFPRQEPGKAIAARTLNRPIAAAEALTRATPAPGIASQIVAGVPCDRALLAREVQARITGGGSGGKYAWQGVWGYAGHYTDLPSRISGTVAVDPAYELNGNSTIAAGKIVTLEREPYTGKWVFQFGVCT